MRRGGCDEQLQWVTCPETCANGKSFSRRAGFRVDIGGRKRKCHLANKTWFLQQRSVRTNLATTCQLGLKTQHGRVLPKIHH